MTPHSFAPFGMAPVDAEAVEPMRFPFGFSRRGFVQTLGAGLMIAASPLPALAQRSGGRTGGRGQSVAARLHLGKDGSITVLTGKIEMGQGARAELSQAAAEELRVPVDRIRMIMGDTSQVPDDGITAGSRTTPATVPSVRQAAATARNLLIDLACQRWKVDRSMIEVRDGLITQAASKKQLTYADLADSTEVAQAFAQTVSTDVSLTPVKEWKVLGTSVPRPNQRDLVTGAHQFPSDIARPGMLYGKVLRAPSYGAKLISVDLEPAKAMKEVVAVQDGQFVGVAAPTSHLARLALAAIAATAKWEPALHPSSKEVFDYLKARVPSRNDLQNPFEADLAKAAKVLKQAYRIPYVQHAPLETRAAVAEWADGTLTVWTCTQNPFGYHGELSRTFRLANDKVRVLVPDFGSGYGGKHTGEAAIEAARLAQAAARPVIVKWTRTEEFTWAYFRPAAVIEIEAGLDDQGRLKIWHFVNINAGSSGVDTPYRVPQARSRAIASNSPLRQGSYRALASTGSNFARECFMDELAAAAGADPLEFRLAHLEHPRLRAVLEAAAQRFGWTERSRKKSPDTGVGLACGTEKGSFVATCVEIARDRATGDIQVRQVCEVFECGAVLNPNNLLSQIQSCIVMGLGPALREQMEFENGRMLNASFRQYPVPRFQDLPALDIHVLSRPDLPSVGAGETPMIGLAPAIANAVYQATGKRVRELPIRWPSGAS